MAMCDVTIDRRPGPPGELSRTRERLTPGFGFAAPTHCGGAVGGLRICPDGSRRSGPEAGVATGFALPTMVARIGTVVMEPGSLVMERKMLLGIKQR